jgi:hypothetical protein
LLVAVAAPEVAKVNLDIPGTRQMAAQVEEPLVLPGLIQVMILTIALVAEVALR